MEKITIDLTTIIFHICKMKANKFVTCVNKYARDTRYNVLEDENVCELKDTKIINILDMEYFGIYSHKMRVDYLKKYYIRNIIENWGNMEIEDQETLLLAFC